MILGLDFGTSTTGVSELDTLGRKSLLSIGFQGSDLIPSLIAETNSGEWLFGQEALIEYQSNPGSRLIRNCKNFIGDSPTVSSNDSEDALIAKFLTFVLNQVKLKYKYDAIRDTQIKLRVSCPASWNWQQRSRLLNILVNKIGVQVSNSEIVDEPSAAGVNFANFLSQQNEGHRALVFDMGGGTLDIAVLTVVKNESELTILSARSDPIAGNKLDDLITQKFMDSALQVFHPQQYLALQDLRTSAERLAASLSLNPEDVEGLIDWVRFRAEDLKKSDLAQNQDASIPLFLEFLKSRFTEINLVGQNDFDLEISAELFQEMVYEFLNSTISLINVTIQKSLYTGSNIDEIGSSWAQSTQTIDSVILAGGMANIAAIRNWIEDEFPGKLVEAYFGEPQNLVATGLAPSNLYQEDFPANSRFRPNFHLASGEEIFLYAYTPLFDINPGSREGLFLQVIAKGEGYITKLNLLLQPLQQFGSSIHSGTRAVSIYPDGRMFHLGEVWDIFTGKNLTEKPTVSKGCSKCGRLQCPGICSN